MVRRGVANKTMVCGTSDGASNMIGKHSGALTKFAEIFVYMIIN